MTTVMRPQTPSCIDSATSYSLRRMRALAAACLVVSIAVSAMTAPAAEAAQTNAVGIVAAGKSDWRIVSSSVTVPGVDWAAKELQKYILQMSGCELPIAKRPGSKPALIIGLRDKLSLADRALLPPTAPGYDGYAIAVCAPAGNTPAHIVIRSEEHTSELQSL